MPVITCTECGHHPLSTLAEKCPSCAVPVAVLLATAGRPPQIAHSTATGSVSGGPKAEAPPRGPATRLDVKKIVSELLELSRPTGRLYYLYPRRLAKSQASFWNNSAMSGDMDAAFLIAITSSDNSDEELIQLRPLADKGNLPSMWIVGYELSSDEKSSSYRQGLAMLKQAASQGVDLALYAYARNLDHERGWDEKLSTIQRLAEKNFPPAMARYGERLLDTIDTEPEHRRKRILQMGFEMLRKAAELGSEDAADHLKFVFERGGIVPMSMHEATFWKNRSKQISDERDCCPMDAYGIKQLMKDGWLTEDDL